MASCTNEQRIHYERIHRLYEEHYYDKWSMAYREEFIYPLFWGGLDLNSKHVADLACGSGYNSAALLRQFPSARVQGFDISPSACAGYRALVKAPAHEVDLTHNFPNHTAFDAAFVVGGLHHCVSDMPSTLRNVAAMLRPGAVFMMMEPSDQHFLEPLRKIWYKVDNSFDGSGNEAALNHDKLAELGQRWFRPVDCAYFGGPAYFGVLNSMILRIPLWAKPRLSPALMAAERLWNRATSRRMHNVFFARWERLPT